MFSVHVTKDYLVFCSAHFITYGGLCESLHGHNYRMAITLEGTLDDNHYVFDFVTLKRIGKALCDTLDHRLILPARNTHLDLQPDGDGLIVRFKGRTYRFPQEDVVLLPLPNTTAEMLARYLAGRLRHEPRLAQVTNLTAIEVEVEESFGQSARYRRAWDTGEAEDSLDLISIASLGPPVPGAQVAP
ncbi:MAG: 6-carboxytetrahydropterin synthase [Chloroflexi bacterium]|nr:6-carboxytetrahydropterin synthase [Chloroflexota bacterium]